MLKKMHTLLSPGSLFFVQVRDPLDEHNNVAYSCHRVERIQTVFRVAVRCLAWYSTGECRSLPVGQRELVAQWMMLKQRRWDCNLGAALCMMSMRLLLMYSSQFNGFNGYPHLVIDIFLQGGRCQVRVIDRGGYTRTWLAYTPK